MLSLLLQSRCRQCLCVALLGTRWSTSDVFPTVSSPSTSTFNRFGRAGGFFFASFRRAAGKDLNSTSRLRSFTTGWSHVA